MASEIQESSELFRESGQEGLSPTRFAKLLDITEMELASALGVHLNVLRLHPEDERVQSRLSAFSGVFARLLELRPDPIAAAFHMKNTPIRVLSHRTLFEAVKDNDSQEALRYLQTISGGQSG
ncbi:DNA-binding protein [Lysobacter gummosus]|uniref:DNA-binding protein n=1 Tax=Lysobacter gummosus TaxID=262324 RepID=A0ABY3XGF7_9GAMM|nr:DNA-binding protein [Lysobacter gummosus]UNP30726.1 DNA-binding protein [Lysobacter gummosus]